MPQFDEIELRQIYESDDTEELQQRLVRGLEPEAERLALQILAERGASPLVTTNLISDHDVVSQAWTPELRLAEQDLAKKLWRSPLVWVCQFLIFFLPFAMVNFFSGWSAKSSLTIVDLFIGWIVIYGGYRVGMMITRKIVASDTKRYPQKVKLLWGLLFGTLVTYGVIIGAATHIFR